jgi:hypothetical protein
MTTTAGAPLEPLRYAYKPSIGGAPLLFELTGQGLSISTGYRTDNWRYDDIGQVRLSYRPVSMLRHRFRTDLRHRDGRKLRIVSATWAGIVALTPQDDSYRAFVEELHRRIGAAAGGVVCLAGFPQLQFGLAAFVFVAMLLVLVGLMVHALASGERVAALFLLGFAVWSGWYLGSWLKRNRPLRYDPSSVPNELLP